MNLNIKLSAVQRATLWTHSGNEGWIGVEPFGKAYHVIVPVDVQIARGVMACNKPTDGTPFGGYSNWIYFRCQPYDSDIDNETLRLEQAKKNLSDLLARLAQYGVIAEPEHDHPLPPQLSINTATLDKIKKIFCTKCSRSWTHIYEVLDDPDLRLVGYRANVDDFDEGVYLFQHGCGSTVELPVSVLIKPQRKIKSLASLTACPGLCYYEKILNSCKAFCEGSKYRKVANRLASRHLIRVTEERSEEHKLSD